MDDLATDSPSRPAVIGRESELNCLHAFLDGVRNGPKVLLVEGEAGAGKTTLWEEALLSAAQSSYRVLACRPVEPEATIAFSGLHDLFRDALDETAASLPQPQRHALEVALLRADVDGSPPDRRAIALATLTVIRSLARSRLLLLGVDDIQWLDGATAGVLNFALRRLTHEPVGVVAALRSGEKSPQDL